MPLPTNGTLSLQGHSRPGDTVHSKPKQAMIVRMSAETLEELESFPQQPPMEFEFGENPGIYIGDVYFPMRSLKEGTPHELYLRASSAAKPMAPLKLCANVIGKFTVERELREKTQAQLRDRTREEEKLRRGHKTQYLETPPDLPPVNGKKRKPPQASSMFRKPTDHLRPVASTSSNTISRPASPLPPPSNSTRESSPPIRRRLIQCLAVAERTTDEVVKLVGGGDPDSSSRRDFMNLLDDVAEHTPTKKGGDPSSRLWRLKTQTWLEVRPYEWPRLSEAQRTNMARNARRAFQAMKTPESDPAWAHVTYRAPSTAGLPPTAADLSKGTTGVRATPNTGTAKTEVPKRGVTSKDAKEKKAQARADSARAKGEVLMKDESKVTPRVSSANTSIKGREREVAGEIETKVSAGSPSGANPPTRKGPGSGYRVTKTNSQDSRGGSASTSSPNPTPIQKPMDGRTKDREPPATSLPTMSAPPIPSSVPNREKKIAGSSTSVPKMKRTKEPALGGFDSDRQPDTDRELDRVMRRGDEEKIRERAKDKDGPLASVKRKKPAREWDEEGVTAPAAQKRRKTDDGHTSLAATSSREHEPRARDFSLSKKTDFPAASRPNDRKESPSPSLPIRMKVRKDREGSPSTSSLASVRPKAKKEPSPTRNSAVLPPKGSSGSSQHHADYPPERSAKANRAGSKTRRKSPIYTSSDEEDVRRRDTTSNAVSHVQTHANTHTHSHPRVHARPRPSLPALTDHAGLRARYNSSYLEYITTFQKVLAQKGKIEQLLKTGNGSITDSDGDVELMDAEELFRLSAEHQALKDELEKIHKVFTGSRQGASLSD